MSAGPFPSEAAAIVFAVVFIAWMLSEVIGAGILPAMRRGFARLPHRHPGSNILIMIDWIVLFLACTIFAQRSIALLPEWSFYVGIALMVLGIIVRQWAIVVLGKWFSGSIAIQEGHQVVDVGPYRLVRHPSYTGALMIQIGIGLAFASWGAVLVIIVSFAIAYGQRMLIEEKELREQLGKRYADYMRRTKRLVPFLV
ncbi:MAG TPA: isoprenylcysteine carboxylmethyltransferase family protein [Methanomassiliicoccales archaeon]|nr:isoprenylcysteine carboxylmethyltransferase family protein [Methanomassiliicoccales archaeon]